MWLVDHGDFGKKTLEFRSKAIFSEKITKSEKSQELIQILTNFVRFRNYRLNNFEFNQIINQTYLEALAVQIGHVERSKWRQNRTRVVLAAKKGELLEVFESDESFAIFKVLLCIIQRPRKKIIQFMLIEITI